MSNEENIVKKVKEELGLTNQQLAEILGQTEPTIYNWIKKPPKIAEFALNKMLELETERREKENLQKELTEIKSAFSTIKGLLK